MSKETFDDNCPGCRPALIDLETGKPMAADSPQMIAVMKFWETTTLDERRAFHDVCCNNSRLPDDMERFRSLCLRMEDSMKTAP